MNAAVLVPVKGFSSAKQRLSPVLSPDERMRLARWLADGVLSSLAEQAVFVACDDDEVYEWATERGATALWGPGLGLNGAVDDGVTQITAAGFEHITVTHADLPFPQRIATIARHDTITLVPDRRRDGTNVMSFPVDHAPPASYGGGSFARHMNAAVQRGCRVEVRADAHLSLDIDTPADLTHPLTSEVLPAWLPTIPVNRSTHGA